MLAVLAMLARPACAEDPQTIEALRRDLEATKRRLEAIEALTKKQEEMIRRQEAVIQKMSGAPAPKAPVPETATSAPEKPDQAQLEKTVADAVMRRIQPTLAAANKTFPSQFNPAIGVMIDTVGSYEDRDGANWEFRSAEIGLSASVDPFVRAYAMFNGTPDGVDVEEAAIVTTSLPYNLTLKGGRFFADFGRLSKFHDHDLPFVNRPIVLDRYVGGESQADGVEASVLLPLPSYVTLTGGWYNKIGDDNERVDDLVPRDLSEFTYLGRAATFFNLTDTQSVDLGGSWAYTPRVDVDRDHTRNLAGVDVTYRYNPLQEAAYRGLTWGTEVLFNQETTPLDGKSVDDPMAVFRNRTRTGLYSYVEAKVTRRLYPGFLYEWVEDLDGRGDSQGFSPYLTIWASEFQRIRLQYTRLEVPGPRDQNEFFLQWTVALGSHVHGFRER
jgi:hypothetical protein